eukprot:CAMPEP_0198238392 /NCGR_PEP_ID=MMETSP1446-20131203/4032_1 /TAXON_ID=1461542 ORGANISM="Unidentified sp, Strain CCMP2111" /NCGR_SAMPLE_ID=MMETSP1446 /ASSEMBLY_ACC=CAM_ASM_001112 /LENGTH=1212 /DNA_ID=CAMNT_0043920785 /DNA_START=261 /DNA_END=3899 /DNA_ORIENTATION=-
MIVQVRGISGENFPVEVSCSLSGGDLKQKLVDAYPNLTGRQMSIFLRGKQLSDGEQCDPKLLKEDEFLSVILKKRRSPLQRCSQSSTSAQIVSQKGAADAVVVSHGTDTSLESNHLFPHVDVSQDLALPQCFEDLYARFQELSTLVGLMQEQGLTPTLATLHETLPWFGEPMIKILTALAPSLVACRTVVSSNAQSEDLVVDFCTVIPGQNPRLPVVGLLEMEDDTPPRLVQGSRANACASESNMAKRQKAAASTMKRKVLRWQETFREALLDVTLVEHELFLKTSLRSHDCAVNKDEAEMKHWHPDFDLKGLTLSKLVQTASDYPLGSDRRPRTSGRRRQTPDRTTCQFEPCPCGKPIENVANFISHLENKVSSGPSLLSRIVHTKVLDSRNGQFSEEPLERRFHQHVAEALSRGLGIRRLYSHQECASRAAMEGKNVIVTTPTASGKSVCYNAPVLHFLVENPGACALYMFPTKALAQDQFRTLQVLCKHVPGIDSTMHIGVYDGDTPCDARNQLTEHARILICNPDIIHCTILPRHKQFQRFFSGLKFIVLDEAHAYRGIFGSHVSLVLRRLRRVMDKVYDVQPGFFVSSATIANSLAHAQNLTGLVDWTLVKDSGSPCGQKTFLLWNPPSKHHAASKKTKKTSTALEGKATGNGKAPALTQCGELSEAYEATRARQLQKREKRKAEERASPQTRRLSPIVEIAMLFAECVQHGLKVIVFCGTRKLSELVLSHAREKLRLMNSDRCDAVAAYRSGYSASHRRAIESSLFSGKLRGVAATNALELGIDVGALDVTLHLGFPGSVSSLWQQSGRAGRREQRALSIYVAFDSALDQFFMRNPEKLFEAPIEHATVDFQNNVLLASHVACASYETPVVVESDVAYFGSGLSQCCINLQKRHVLGRNPECTTDQRWYCILEVNPAHAINLRAIDENVWKVVDERTRRVIEEIEESKAFFQIYEGAVYLQQGRKYVCTGLDMDERVASVRRADLKYYTSLRDFTDIVVTGGKPAYSLTEHQLATMVPLYGSTATLGSARHVTRFIGFNKIWQRSGKVFDSVELTLPPVAYDTICVWIRIPDKARVEIEHQGKELRAGVHAASHALLNVLPLYLMCNRADVGVECVNNHETRWRPERLLIYDKQPGGTGIAAQVQPLFGNLLRAAQTLVQECPCTEPTGCPSCVHSGDCDEYNDALDKAGALIIFQAIIDAEEVHF